ncbi:MAG: tetratricopeptide repeat protein [PVC group bacterium]|nr:tetratricopeptide repeat protein [PVC group bacterium]
MKKIFVFKSIILFLILSFLVMPAYAKINTPQSHKSLKKLFKLSRNLLKEMDIVNANSRDNQNILDIKRVLGPLSWDCSNVIELYSLSLTLKGARNQKSAESAFYRNCEYFTAYCDTTIQELDTLIPDVKNKKEKSALKKICRIITSIKKEIKPHVDFYAIEENRNKYAFSIDTDKAWELNDYVTKLFQHISTVKHIAAYNKIAADIDRALNLYSLFVDHLNIIFAMWDDSSKGSDQDQLFSALGDSISRTREYYYLTNYAVNVLLLEISPDDDKNSLYNTGRDIDTLMNKIEHFLEPYEVAYVKTDPEAAKAKQAREDLARSRGYEAEGEYAFIRGNFTKAIKKLTAAIKLHPFYSRAYYFLALSGVKAGDIPTAKEILTDFISFAEKNKNALKGEDLQYFEKCKIILEELNTLN